MRVFKLTGSRWVSWARGEVVVYLGDSVFLYPDGRIVEFVKEEDFEGMEEIG